MSEATRPQPSPANRLGLDYREEAAKLGPPVVPIIDGHSHINGSRAAEIYRDIRSLFGVVRTFTQTQLSEADNVQAVLGDSVHFVAVPEYMSSDQKHAHTQGFIDNITEWHRRGARMVKFWSAPRGRDFGREIGDTTLLTLENPWRRKQMDHAASLDMMFMVHIADPDTWFATKYTDTDFYGTKASQYEALEALMEEYDRPWLLAHMGGSPEDLHFLAGLLERHPKAVVDTSATKWMVRELSKHPREELVQFLSRFRGRIIWGTDIVTMDAHLSHETGPRDMGAQAASEDEAYELYASRYWAMRALFESSYDDESPIADPDLHMVAPDQFDENAAPRLRGMALPVDMLRDVYSDACRDSLLKWYEEH
jgi:hypothetical protein